MAAGSIDTALLFAVGVGGLVLGVICAIVWRSLLRRIGPEDSVTLASLSRAVLTEKTPDKLIAEYGRLMRLVGAYALGNVVGLLLGLLPLIAILTVWGPQLMSVWDDGADYLEIYPAKAGTIANAPELSGAQVDTDRSLLELAGDSRRTLQLPDADYVLDPVWARHGFCAGLLTCATLESLQFNVQPRVAVVKNAGYVVVRPSRPDWNPLWPFLGDLEFVLFSAFFVGNAVGFAWIRRRI